MHCDRGSSRTQCALESTIPSCASVTLAYESHPKIAQSRSKCTLNEGRWKREAIHPITFHTRHVVHGAIATTWPKSLERSPPNRTSERMVSMEPKAAMTNHRLLDAEFDG